MSNEPIQIHMDSNIGLTMDQPEVKEINNCHGQHYWIATAKIGSIFGAEAEGELKGIGATREIALERLKQEHKNLADSLWA